MRQSSRASIVGVAYYARYASPFWAYRYGSIAIYRSKRQLLSFLFVQHDFNAQICVNDMILPSRYPLQWLAFVGDVIACSLQLAHASFPLALVEAEQTWFHGRRPSGYFLRFPKSVRQFSSTFHAWAMCLSRFTNARLYQLAEMEGRSMILSATDRGGNNVLSMSTKLTWNLLSSAFLSPSCIYFLLSTSTFEKGTIFNQYLSVLSKEISAAYSVETASIQYT